RPGAQAPQPGRGGVHVPARLHRPADEGHPAQPDAVRQSVVAAAVGRRLSEPGRGTVVPRQEAADSALHNGDAEPRMQLWSHNDPVTLLGAFGVAARGWKEVSETFR